MLNGTKIQLRTIIRDHLSRMIFLIFSIQYFTSVNKIPSIKKIFIISKNKKGRLNDCDDISQFIQYQNFLIQKPNLR